LAISSEWASLENFTQPMNSASMGVVDPAAFAALLQTARKGDAVPLTRLMRTVFVEAWLRQVRRHGILTNSIEEAMDSVPHLGAALISAENIRAKGGENK
jgi:hypothetical protein